MLRLPYFPRPCSSSSSLDVSVSMMYVSVAPGCFPALTWFTESLEALLGGDEAVRASVLVGVVRVCAVVRGEPGVAWVSGAVNSVKGAGEESGPLGDSDMRRQPGLRLDCELALRSLTLP